MKDIDKEVIGDYKDFEKYLGVKPKAIRFGNFKETPYKVGDYRVLPKGTEVWCIDFQTRISFVEDEIIEVTHTTCYGDLFFGKLKQVIGQLMFPGLIGKGTGEIETLFSLTTDFIMPLPGICVQYLLKDNQELNERHNS